MLVGMGCPCNLSTPVLIINPHRSKHKTTAIIPLINGSFLLKFLWTAEHYFCLCVCSCARKDRCERADEPLRFASRPEQCVRLSVHPNNISVTMSEVQVSFVWLFSNYFLLFVFLCLSPSVFSLILSLFLTLSFFVSVLSYSLFFRPKTFPILPPVLTAHLRTTLKRRGTLWADASTVCPPRHGRSLPSHVTGVRHSSALLKLFFQLVKGRWSSQCVCWQVTSVWWSSIWNPKRRGRSSPAWISFSTTAASISRKSADSHAVRRKTAAVARRHTTFKVEVCLYGTVLCVFTASNWGRNVIFVSRWQIFDELRDEIRLLMSFH